MKGFSKMKAAAVILVAFLTAMHSRSFSDVYGWCDGITAVVVALAALHTDPRDGEKV